MLIAFIPNFCYFQAMLVGGICPGTEDPALCEENLPEFWSMVAAVLWPGYWDPTVSWISKILSHFAISIARLSMCFSTRPSGCAPLLVQPLRTFP